LDPDTFFVTYFAMLLYNDRVQMYGFASQILLCKSAELAGCGSRGGAASLHVAMGVTHRILPSDAKELAQIISSCRLVRGAPSLFGRNFRNPGLIRLPVRARGWTTCLCSECADSGKVTDILFEARGAQILILQYSRDNSTPPKIPKAVAMRKFRQGDRQPFRGVGSQFNSS